jgi:TM2 domain-containing membrane protein YozV
MNQCPECNARIETWETSCHKCGKTLADAKPVEIDNASYAKAYLSGSADLKESCLQWLESAEAALQQKDYERAIVDFQETLRRANGIAEKDRTDTRLSVDQIRYKLAQTLQKAGKLVEAHSQYTYIAEHASNKRLVESSRKKIETLSAKVGEHGINNGEEFKSLESADLKYAPLYCASCKRLLSEAEVYGFRKNISPFLRCLCGFEGQPIVKHDTAYKKALQQAPVVGQKRQDLIDLAEAKIPNAKKRSTAIILAILLGNFGVHRFYLGENLSGFLYLAFCWTFIPWLVALFDAAGFAQSSDTTFNLMYNVEEMVKLLPEEKATPSKIDQFNMEIFDDPEDFIDELSV